MKRFLTDIIFFSIYLFIAFLLFSPLLKGTYLETGYEDWFMHVYRAELLKNFGYTSWIHLTSGGQFMWQAYQFIPHLCAAVYSTLTGLPVYTAVLHITIICLAFFVITKYICLRLLKVSPYITFIICAVSLGIPQISILIMDYTSLFGFAFLPLFIFLIIKNAQSPKVGWISLLLGTVFYIHPILGFIVLPLWGFITFFNQPKNFKKIIFEFLIIVLTAAFFVIPITMYSGNYYKSIFFGNVLWARGLVTYSNLGISNAVKLLSLFGFIMYVFLWNRVPQEKRTGLAIYTFGAVILFLIKLIYSYEHLPEFLVAVQVVRWGPHLYTFLTFFTALFLARLDFKNGNVIFKGVLLIFLSLFLLENIDPEGSTSMLRYLPTARSNPKDFVNAFFTENPTYYAPGIKLRTEDPTRNVYFNFNSIRTENSYFHYSPDGMSPILHDYMYQTPSPNLEKISQYLRARDVSLVFISSSTGTAKLFLNSNPSPYPYKLVGNVYNGKEKILVFKTPWNQLDAIQFDTQKNPLRTFPSVHKHWKDYDTKEIDVYVSYYYNYLQENNYEKVEISYPSQSEITISNLKPGHTALVYESYDNAWKLKNSDLDISISLQGPSIIGVENKSNAVKTVTIFHDFATSDKIAIKIVPFGLVVFIIAKCYEMVSSIRAKKKAVKAIA